MNATKLKRSLPTSWRQSSIFCAAALAFILPPGGYRAAAGAEERDSAKLKNERAIAAEEPGGAAIDPKWIGGEFHAALVIRPPLIENSKLLSSIPQADLDKFVAALDRGKLPLGFDKIERVTILLGVGPRKQAGKYIPGTPDTKGSWEMVEKMSPLGCAIVQFTETFDPAQGAKKLYAKPKSTKVGGGEYFSYDSDFPTAEVSFFPDNRTLVVTDPQTAEQMIAGKLKPGPLAALVAGAPEKGVVAVGQGDDAMMARIDALLKTLNDGDTRELGPALEFAKKARGLKAELDLDAADLLKGTLQMADEETAKQLADLAVGGLALLKFQYGREKPKMVEQLPPHLRTALPGTIDQLFDGVKIERSGTTIAVNLVTPKDLPKLVPAVVPFVESMRKQARNAALLNSMRQIGVASLSYETATRYLPVDYKDAAGKPLLSWRVALLPYIDDRGLHKKFKLDEPWNSPHNIKLLDQMPVIYRDSNDSEGKPTTTRFVRPIGPGTPFEKGDKTSVSSIAIKDGTSNTVMVIQVGPDKAVPWTKPDDAPFDPADPWKSLGTIDETGLPALFFDTSVRMLPRATKPATLKSLFQHADGESVELP